MLDNRDIVEKLISNALTECEKDDNRGMTDPYGCSLSEKEPKTVRNAEIMKKIVNLLAENKCTVQDAEDILQGALASVYNTATVRMLNY